MRHSLTLATAWGALVIIASSTVIYAEEDMEMGLERGGTLIVAEAPILTRSAVLAAADAEAQRLGYDIERMSVSFDYYNSLWTDHYKAVADTPHSNLRALEGRDFFAVYYGPLKKQLGGDLWVFVERLTGEIITTIQGK